MSGIDGEIGRSHDLTSEMGEAPKDLDERARDESDAKRAHEEEKKRIGRLMASMAMNRRSTLGEADSDRL